MAISSLIKGSKLFCPRCEEWQDLLSYTPLQQIEQYESVTNQVLKCANCRHVFSPSYSISELMFILKAAREKDN